MSSFWGMRVSALIQDERNFTMKNLRNSLIADVSAFLLVCITQQNHIIPYKNLFSSTQNFRSNIHSKNHSKFNKNSIYFRSPKKYIFSDINNNHLFSLNYKRKFPAKNFSHTRHKNPQIYTKRCFILLNIFLIDSLHKSFRIQ